MIVFSETRSSDGYGMEPLAQQLPQLLQAWLDELIPVVYDDLHRLARRYIADERPGHTLQPTALVNEAYLRLSGSAHPSWQSRAHVFAVCARQVPEETVARDWKLSKSWLRREMGREPSRGS
jgi:hypothetical protein